MPRWCPVLLAAINIASHPAVAAESAAAPDNDAVAATSSSTTLELDTTSVTGNRELPRVMVIVPWKSSEITEQNGRPLNSLVEEVLAPLEPAVFRRQLQYYNSLNDAQPFGESSGNPR